MLIEEDYQPDLNLSRLVQQNSLCSEPTTVCVDDRTDNLSANKCSCSISYPNFQLNNLEHQKPSLVEKESSSTSSGKQLIKSLRNKLNKFGGESSFDEQAIALNEFNLNDEPNNNNVIKSNDQTSLISTLSSTTNVTNIGQTNLANNVQNGKCIFLAGLNQNNLTLKMDNV